MLKKIILIVMIMNLFIMTNSLAEVKDFENHWAKKEIENFIENEFIKLENNNFRPDEYITRGEFVHLINNVFTFTNPSNLEFIDVLPSDEYYEDVLIARNQGYILGYLDNTFKPNKTISRQEAAKIFSNIMVLDNVSSNLLLNYNDVSSFPDWSKEFLSSVVENGYFSGYPDGTLRPYDNIKRAEAIKMIDNIIEDEPDERIYKYRDITDLGEPNLNAYDLKMLVGKDPSVIQLKIKTAADLL
ncbi:S-layer homology domain-containing protein [Clostridiaceae bacterium HSG29]|nr:S-layer homology domain-containing protein [Clostridiaceae bacterium HSG29]